MQDEDDDSPGDAGTVTVGSLDKDLGLATYSSRGYTSDLRVKPDVAVIYSIITQMQQLAWLHKQIRNKYGNLDGSDCSTMIQANPDLTPKFKVSSE